MIVQGNDILYNDLPTSNLKRNLKHTMTKLKGNENVLLA